jgi:uncharacterized protein YlxP (DUF503 family)
VKCAVGVLTLELLMAHSHSLKERRSVVNSLKERIRNRYNVSVAEADFGDVWQRAGLIITTGAAWPATADETLKNVLNFIDQDARAQVLMPSIRYYE